MKRILLYIACLCISVSAWANQRYSVILPVPVNVYENAIVDAKVIGTLSPKQTVDVYVVNGDWAIIQYEGGVGYVAAACLKEVKDEPAAATQQPAPAEQPQAEPAPAQPAAQPQPVASQPQKPAETPRSTPASPSAGTGNSYYEPFATYSLYSKDDPAADILDCRFNMYFTFSYLMSTQKDMLAKQNILDPLHGGQFEYGFVFKLWGPIGLDFNFGMDMSGRKYEPALPPYELSHECTKHLRLNMSMALRPVFGINLDTDWDLQVYTGPRFLLNFMDLQRSEVGGEGDFGTDMEECDLFDKKKSICTPFTIPWGVGFGFNYKSIGMRVCYEWELYNRYKKDYQILGDHRYNYLVVSMYIPIHL